MSQLPPFLGVKAAASGQDKARFSIIPVPYDQTSTWKKGADAGPAAILEASAQVELFDLQTGCEPHRAGILTLPEIRFSGPPEQLAVEVARVVGAEIDQGRMPVVLGGEHSVSIGAINAVADRFADLSVLQIDAHADTRETYEGSTHNHACVMARARERCAIVQVGIRSVDASEMEHLDTNRVFFAHDIVGNPDRSWMDRVADLLTDHVYITIDLDGLDPSIIPATGTPEPGGLDWYEVDELLRRVIDRTEAVAFDVVELLPMAGHHACEFTAAKLVHRVLSMIVRKPGTESHPIVDRGVEP